MRVRDNLTQCVCFLCVQKREQDRTMLHYGGTAFFVSVPSNAASGGQYIYVVTAKHCIEKAKNSGDLFLRINTQDGGVELIKMTSEWDYPDNEAVDLAVLREELPDTCEFTSIPMEMLATDEVIQREQIGIGDNLVITGLFTQHYGTQRNLPIVRTGIIASMPHEPLQDENTGFDYEAFLAEVRSIGGLSGSPVFVVLDPGRLIKGSLRYHHQTFLLGLIRGHWDYGEKGALIDFRGEELEAVNMGIATLTPIRELFAMLNSKEFAAERRRLDSEALKQQPHTNR
jgi:hypothetical protein